MKITFRIFGIPIAFGMWTIHKLLLLGIAITLFVQWWLGEFPK